jgi:hypothetical protein
MQTRWKTKLGNARRFVGHAWPTKNGMPYSRRLFKKSIRRHAKAVTTGMGFIYG